jgi:hypothetical protein
MAEAHNAAALSFAITHDGISVNYDQELLRDIWHSYSRSSRRRFARFKVRTRYPSAYFNVVAQNNFRAGIFPASALSLFVCATAVVVFYVVLGIDLTCGLTGKLKDYVFYYLFGSVRFNTIEAYATSRV